jgi:hypothetical protein
VVPADIHDFFIAGAGVAGTLIGLLFVAISVAAGRLAKAEAAAQVHRIRAYAALTAFINALTVSLSALIPGKQIGMASLIVAILDLLFVAASLLSLIRMREARLATARDAAFLAGLAATFAWQLISGIDVIQQPGDSGAVETIAWLVIACFLIGIFRSWELIGGPSIGIAHEVVALVRSEAPAKDGGTAAAGGTEGEGAPRA